MVYKYRGSGGGRADRWNKEIRLMLFLQGMEWESHEILFRACVCKGGRFTVMIPGRARKGRDRGGLYMMIDIDRYFIVDS